MTDWESVITILVIATLAVLFAGTPDLMDAIISQLTVVCP